MGGSVFCSCFVPLDFDNVIVSVVCSVGEKGFLKAEKGFLKKEMGLMKTASFCAEALCVGSGTSGGLVF
jgi:hypothetical protein